MLTYIVLQTMDGYRYNKKEKGHIIRDDATRMTLGTHIVNMSFAHSSIIISFAINQTSLVACLSSHSHHSWHCTWGVPGTYPGTWWYPYTVLPGTYARYLVAGTWYCTSTGNIHISAWSKGTNRSSARCRKQKRRKSASIMMALLLLHRHQLH